LRQKEEGTKERDTDKRDDQATMLHRQNNISDNNDIRTLTLDTRAAELLSFNIFVFVSLWRGHLRKVVGWRNYFLLLLLLLLMLQVLFTSHPQIVDNDL